jgi:hypothetical protein
MRLSIDVDEESTAGRYLLACARIRDISPRSLLKRVVDAISTDQLIPSVLDDDGRKTRRKGEHRFSHRPRGA